MYKDERQNQLDAEIQHLENLKRQLRQREKGLKAREMYLSSPEQFQFNTVKSLKEDLKGALMPHMLPANVGALNEVAWPFYFQVRIDFGSDPDISQSVSQRGYFQVDQEASFILMSVSLSYMTDSADLSGVASAPLSVDFIDRQSTRRFSSGPVPIQSIGDNSNPMIFPTGMLIMPNAFLDVEVRGMNPTTQSHTGSGLLQFSFFGYRTRVENAQKVLSTIFG